MTLFRFICGTLLLWVHLDLAPLLALSADQDPVEAANRVFREGKFAEAQALYAQIQARDPSNFQAALRLGTIAFFKNQLADAQTWLSKALKLKPDDQEAMKLLAHVFYRKNVSHQFFRPYALTFDFSEMRLFLK